MVLEWNGLWASFLYLMDKKLRPIHSLNKFSIYLTGEVSVFDVLC